MKEKLNIGLLYLSLHNQLVKKYGTNGIVSRKEFFCKLGKHGQIPKNLRPIVIKEMTEKELIKRIDRDNIQILECEVDLDKDANKLYKIAGLF
ncbi:MAG: hypothetical protein ACLFPS_05905 [Clostridia bacterium]